MLLSYFFFFFSDQVYLIEMLFYWSCLGWITVMWRFGLGQIRMTFTKNELIKSQK